MPIGNLRSSAPRTSEQPGTGGGSRIPKPTTKMASRKCRQKKSSRPWKPLPSGTPAKINSFKYFVQEIITPRDPRNRAWQKKQLEKIVRRIRDTSVGRASYSETDFIEDVKCACAREGVHLTTIFSTNWSPKTCLPTTEAVMMA